MLGKTHSAESKAKISIALSSNKHPLYGKLYTAETKT